MKNARPLLTGSSTARGPRLLERLLGFDGDAAVVGLGQGGGVFVGKDGQLMGVDVKRREGLFFMILTEICSKKYELSWYDFKRISISNMMWPMFKMWLDTKLCVSQRGLCLQETFTQDETETKVMFSKVWSNCRCCHTQMLSTLYLPCEDDMCLPQTTLCLQHNMLATDYVLRRHVFNKKTEHRNNSCQQCTVFCQTCVQQLYVYIYTRIYIYTVCIDKYYIYI